MTERWEPVPENRKYEVSDAGNARVRKEGLGNRWRMIQCRNDEDGYLKLQMHGSPEMYLGDLVNELFNGPPPVGDGNQMWVTGHRDMNPENCKASNLFWEDSNTLNPTISHQLSKAMDAPAREKPSGSLWRAQILVCQKHTGRMYIYPSLQIAASAMDMSVQDLAAKLTLPDVVHQMAKNPREEFVAKHTPKKHVPPEKPLKGGSKIRCIDHGDNRTIVCHTLQGAYLMTGIDADIIAKKLADKDITEIGGFSFKWFHDDRAFPTYDFNQIVKSRMEFMFSKERKPRPEMTYQVKHNTLETIRKYPDLETLCSEEGWTFPVVSSLVNEFPKGVKIGDYHVSPC